MYNHQENLQHFITHLQNKRIKTMEQYPFTFSCGAIITLVCGFLCILHILGVSNSIFEIVFLIVFFIASLLAASCIKNIYRKIFFKVEFMGISFSLATMMLSINLVPIFYNDAVYSVFVALTVLTLGSIIVQFDFVKKIKTDYYSNPKAFQVNPNIVASVVVLTLILLGVFRSILSPETTGFLYATLLLIAGAFPGVLIISCVRNIFLVLRYRLDLTTD